MKMRRLVVAVALALGASGVQAGVTFDPDGPGLAAPVDIGGLGWSTTSGVAVGGNTAIGNFLATGGACGVGSPCTFNILTHARLVDSTNQLSAPNAMPGLNGGYEITMVARFQEVVTFAQTPFPTLASPAGTGFAQFATTGVGLLQIYFDSTPNSNDLTGHGFSDGTLILQGTISEAGKVGSFQVTSPTSVHFDQFGGNNSTGNNYCADGGTPGAANCQGTTSGFGSQEPIAVGGITQDFAFFQTALAAFGINFSNISQSLPFSEVDPSDCFAPAAALGVVGAVTPVGNCILFHNDLPYAGNPDGTGYVPTTGLTNALFGGGPDTVFQTRFASSVTPAQIPEPGSLALLGLGLGAFGLGALKRRRTLETK